MLNLKLFFLKENAPQVISEKLNNLGKRNFQLNSEIIAVDYSGESPEYIEVVKTAKNFNLTQFMLISSAFLDLIKVLVLNGFDIEKVDFVYPISEESTEYIKDNISKIYATYDASSKREVLKSLIAEIEWLSTDGCIDIKSITFDYLNDQGIYKKMSLFSNGVVILDSELEVDVLKNIINELRGS